MIADLTLKIDLKDFISSNVDHESALRFNS
jgi:hypothetical protein